MTSTSEQPWRDPLVAVQQRALVDQQLARWKSGEPMPQFSALRDAVAYTQCPGMVLEVGAASGYSMEIVPEEFRARFSGVDISSAAIEMAVAKYPGQRWFVGSFLGGYVRAQDARRSPVEVETFANGPLYDVAIDGSCLLHVEEWKAHLQRLCLASRRWVILHRVPIAADTHRYETHGYGQTFPAWKFASADVEREMLSHGFQLVKTFPADDGASTAVFAKPRIFCTYADAAYASRLGALYRSLRRHAGPFVLHVLDWSVGGMPMRKHLGDDLTPDDVIFWPHGEFLDDHPELRPENLPGSARSKVEHFWTCGPAFIAEVMEATGGPVTYLDADLFQFSSMEPMFAEIGGAAAGFVGHNFARKDAGLPGPTVETHALAFGRLNVGSLHFADPAIAARWAELCRQWCYDRPEMTPDGRVRYADQKYLEWLCDEFPGVHVVKEPAAHVGPWGIHCRGLHKRGETIYFGDKPIALFHFSSLKLLPHGNVQIARPEYAITQAQIDMLYLPYIQEISR